MWDQVLSLGWEDPLEEGMATHPSIPAWRIPWAEDLEDYSPRGWKELNTTEHLTLFTFFSRLRYNPLGISTQCPRTPHWPVRCSMSFHPVQFLGTVLLTNTWLVEFYFTHTSLILSIIREVWGVLSLSFFLHSPLLSGSVPCSFKPRSSETGL